MLHIVVDAVLRGDGQLDPADKAHHGRHPVIVRRLRRRGKRRVRALRRAA